MSTDWRNFAVIFVVGIVLISIGYAIPLYPQSIISNLQSNLNSGTLSKEDIYAQQGSLSWWKLALNQTYKPLSEIIGFAGWLTLALSLVYASFALLLYFIQRRKNGEINLPNQTSVKKINQLGNPPSKPIIIADAQVISRKARKDLPTEPEQEATVVLDEEHPEYEPSLPFEDKQIENEAMVKEKLSWLWYLLPLLLGFIGGIFGYFKTRKCDKELADFLFFFGILWSFILFILYWLLVSRP